MFTPWKKFTVAGCDAIRAITVGRSALTMRIFVTCTYQGTTVVKLVDRVKVASHSVSTTEEDIEFHTLPYSLKIELDSQPFVGDLNGDYLDDIMFTEPGATSQVMVALQIPEKVLDQPPTFFTTTFEHALLIRDENYGCIDKPIENKRLTVPHSIGLVDFDGDCMADLFVTVQDLTTGKKYYEIYLRREVSESVKITTTSETQTSTPSNSTTAQTSSASEEESAEQLTGLGSFCLVQREEVPE